MNQTCAVVQQHIAVDIERLLDNVFAVSQPLAVTCDLIDFPSGRCPADVVAHYRPLTLTLHDDAVTVHERA